MKKARLLTQQFENKLITLQQHWKAMENVNLKIQALNFLGFTFCEDISQDIDFYNKEYWIYIADFKGILSNCQQKFGQHKNCTAQIRNRNRSEDKTKFVRNNNNFQRVKISLEEIFHWKNVIYSILLNGKKGIKIYKKT